MQAHDLLGGEALGAKLFQMLAAAAEGYVSCVDRQRRILYLNRTLSRDLSAILGQPMEAFIAAPHRQAAIACVERAFESGELQQLDYEAELGDAVRRAFRTRFIPFRGPGDQPLALMLTDDLTERQSLVEELERSQEFRRRVVEQLPDFVVLVDRAQRFVWVNRLAPGLALSDVIGSAFTDFVTPESRQPAAAAIEAAFAHGTASHFESEGYSDANSKAWYLTRVAPVFHEGKVENVLVVGSDITALKRAELALRETERQLHQAQRMEGIGQLAGGIAHDFNNLLQVIQGNLQFAQRFIARGESALTEVSEAMRATERAAELTSHLLAIGRRQRVAARRVDVGALVANSLRMLRRAIPENIELAYEPPSQPWFAELDSQQFEQVLLNLCVNARDAMPGGGRLSVRVEPDGESHLLVSVIDTGMGIPQEHLSRVFDPFFTTKRTGSGLGLAVAAGIVAAHGGAIVAQSPGEGTHMRIRLPRVEAELTPALPPAVDSLEGSGVILVAEDEGLVRAQVVRMLAAAGYTVLEAEHGGRAVELFSEHKDTVELALLDVVMPVLDGWQTFLQLRAIKPALPVVFTTGYAASVLPEDFAAYGARVLTKPFKPTALLALVHEVLALQASAQRNL